MHHELGLIAEAAGLFAVTNIGNIVVLSLFSPRRRGHGSAWRPGQEMTASQRLSNYQTTLRMEAGPLSRPN